MRGFKYLTTFVLFAGMMPALHAQTAPISACTAQTLAVYDGMSTACSIGILDFNGFTFDTGGTDTTPLAASMIEVTPVANGLGGSFNFSVLPPAGTVIPGQFTAPAGESADYFIDYDFVVVIDPVVAGASLGMDPPFGDVSITQLFCLDTTFTFLDVTNGAGGGVACEDANDDLSAPQSLNVNDMTPPTSWFNSIDFAPPAMNSGQVRTLIDINNSLGDDSGFDSVSAGLVVADGPLTPEPATYLLALGGLALVGIRRKLTGHS